jgi:hypothetical protein
MTKGKWLACKDPYLMLDFLRGKASERKLRLFAVACCRHIWHLLADERSQEAVEVAERYADGQASQAELEAAHNRALYARRSARKEAWSGGRPASVQAARSAVRAVTRTAVAETAEEAARAVMEWATRMERVPGVFQGIAGPRAAIQRAWKAELRYQCDLLRDLLGIPFRLVSTIPRDTNVVKLAQAIYNDRAFDGLPILGDALEEAGCTDQAILDHCRQQGEHIRGCWVLDLVLGRG